MEAILAMANLPNGLATIAMWCLIDTCCTGIVAKKLFAETPIDGMYSVLTEESDTWNASNGEFVTDKVIKIEKALLPSLCIRQFFMLDVNVMPHDNCTYDLIIGQNTM